MRAFNFGLIVALAVALGGCGDNPCHNVAGACVMLHVESATIMRLQQLSLTEQLGPNQQLQTRTSPETPDREYSLPFDVALTFPAGLDGTMTLAAVALDNQARVATGSTSFAVGDGLRENATLSLDGPPTSYDLSVPTTPPDFAPPPVADLAPPIVHDLAPPVTGCTSGAIVTTLAGSGVSGFMDGTGGANGTTKFFSMEQIAFDGNGNLVVADSANNRVRVVSLTDGHTTTLTGNGMYGFVQGTGGAQGTTQFRYPKGVALNPGGGTIVIADANNDCISFATADGTTTASIGTPTMSGFLDAANASAKFTDPNGIFFIAGTNATVIADELNHRIRMSVGGNVSTLAGNGTAGFANGTGGANGTAEFKDPTAVIFQGTSYYVADEGNNSIRVIAANGDTTTLAGNGAAGFVDGVGAGAQFAEPTGLASDGTYVYVSDLANHSIRRIDMTNGTTTTIAGNGTAGFVDGDGCTARLNGPWGIVVAGKTIYVGENIGNRIRKIQLP